MDHLPDGLKVDIVDIFRNKRFTDEMVREIAAWSEKTGQKPLIWTQLDVSTSGAKQLAIAAGLPYVENKCLMVEHKRLEIKKKVK
jgi:predicted CoA-binding protein